MNRQTGKIAHSLFLALSIVWIGTGPAFSQDSQPASSSPAAAGPVPGQDPVTNTVTLPLAEALGVALENNLAIQIQKVNIPLSECQAKVEMSYSWQSRNVLFG